MRKEEFYSAMEHGKVGKSTLLLLAALLGLLLTLPLSHCGGVGFESPKRQHVFDLSDFGAVGDGIVDNTRVFQNALYAVSGVANKGGGQLYIPPGRYVTGSFNLTSNMTLYLARNAVILGSKDTDRWPIISPLPSYGRGRELPGPRHSSLLYGSSIQDVLITGENGTIDGQGFNWWKLAESGTLDYSRGSLVELISVKDFVINNVTLRNSPYWALHTVYCKNVRISNITIIAPGDSVGTDGIVPDSSVNVSISEVWISTGGDAISIKSGWDEYGISYNAPSVAIDVSKTILQSGLGAGISIGSEMSGGVRNVTIHSVKISDSSVGMIIKTCQGRGGFVENVYVDSVEVRNVSTAIQFLSNARDHPDKEFDPIALPIVKNLRFKNIVGELVGQAGLLDGVPGLPFEDVFLENVYLALKEGGSGFFCSEIGGWSKNVTPEACPELKPSTSSILESKVYREGVGDSGFINFVGR